MCWTNFGPLEIEIGPLVWVGSESYFTVTKVVCGFSDFGNARSSLFRDVYNFGGIIFDPLSVVGSLIGPFKHIEL